MFPRLLVDWYHPHWKILDLARVDVLPRDAAL